MNNTFYNDQWSELYHYGVKGQKHGERRYQNPDGSLTPEGYEHYGYSRRDLRRLRKDFNEKSRNAESARVDYAVAKEKYNDEIKAFNRIGQKYKTVTNEKKKQKLVKKGLAHLEYAEKNKEIMRKSIDNYKKYHAEYTKMYEKLKADNKLDIYMGLGTAGGMGYKGATNTTDYHKMYALKAVKNGKMKYAKNRELSKKKDDTITRTNYYYY